VGKFERKICFRQKYLYSSLCSQRTLESHTEHSLLVTLMYYKPCTTGSNTEVYIYHTLQ
jgi:hypothetical protein